MITLKQKAIGKLKTGWYSAKKLGNEIDTSEPGRVIRYVKEDSKSKFFMYELRERNKKIKPYNMKERGYKEYKLVKITNQQTKKLK